MPIMYDMGRWDYAQMVFRNPNYMNFAGGFRWGGSSEKENPGQALAALARASQDGWEVIGYQVAGANGSFSVCLLRRWME
jgi:hypothetical protein